jgi:hypothetical protein
MSRRIFWNICRDTATLASWNVTQRPWLTTLAPILISLSRRLVSDHGSAALGIASVRMKFPRIIGEGMELEAGSVGGEGMTAASA